MVEIVKKAQYPVTCGKCGAELKYGYDDTSYDKFLMYYSIQCPICDAEIRVDDPNLDADDYED